MSATELAARGSKFAKRRAAEEKPAEKSRKSRSKPEPKYRPPSDRELKDLITLLPGYDPHRDAEGCRFNCNEARKVITFFETKLRHVEGKVAGKLFKLERWQQAIIANLFGWQTKSDDGQDVRRYREAFIFCARKNGKSPLASGLALYLLTEDNEEGAQIISCAAKRDQAALLFRHARGMVMRSPYLSEKLQVFGGVGQRSIVSRIDPGASFQSISSDANTAHGLNLSAAIIDELHALPSRDLTDTIATSMASANRLQPLLVHITTSDYDRPSICNEKHKYATDVRDGLVPDRAFLPVVFEVPPDADWTDESVWPLANPNIDVSVSREYLPRMQPCDGNSSLRKHFQAAAPKHENRAGPALHSDG